MVKGWKKKVFQANASKKQAGTTILLSYKINFKPKQSEELWKNTK